MKQLVISDSRQAQTLNSSLQLSVEKTTVAENLMKGS